MSETKERAERVATTDLATVASVAIIAYALANLLHEGLGHGVACLLVGGKPRLLSSLHFEGDEEGLARWATRLISASGTLVNLGAAALAFAAMRAARGASAQVRYFLWLVLTVNLLQATGYLLFSGLGNIGDWASVVDGLGPSWLMRLGLALLGGASYWFSVRLVLVGLGPFIGGDRADRLRRALPLTIVPYVSGAVLYCLSGFLNPEGMMLVAISGVAASLGGTSGLAWGPQLLKGDGIPLAGEGPIAIGRSWGWIVAALLVIGLFVFVLGPGIRI